MPFGPRTRICRCSPNANPNLCPSGSPKRSRTESTPATEAESNQKRVHASVLSGCLTSAAPVPGFGCGIGAGGASSPMQHPSRIASTFTYACASSKRAGGNAGRPSRCTPFHGAPSSSHDVSCGAAPPRGSKRVLSLARAGRDPRDRRQASGRPPSAASSAAG
eukprot:scaffold98359_cov33-Tisochrysis_lutea.AAC.2